MISACRRSATGRSDGQGARQSFDAIGFFVEPSDDVFLHGWPRNRDPQLSKGSHVEMGLNGPYGMGLNVLRVQSELITYSK